jgi:hypothetical protein
MLSWPSRGWVVKSISEGQGELVARIMRQSKFDGDAPRESESALKYWSRGVPAL